MNLPQFNRIASVKVGKSGNEQLFDITDLRIGFKVSKNLNTTSNSAVISIYNLSGDTRNKLKEIFDTIILEAGYFQGEGLKLLFTGNITESFTKRNGPDLITVIQSGDGLKAIIETKFNKGYAAGTSAYDILDDILKTFGLPEKITNRLKAIARKKGKKFANAFSSSGSAKSAIDKIIKKLDLEWSIQNGAVKILELESVDDSPITPNIILNPDTGLIGLPTRIQDLKKRQDTKKKIVPGSEIKDIKKKGWKLETLLYPEIEPGGRIKVFEETSGIDGVFRIEEIEQIGDTYGTQWNSFITVSDID